jgi:hypothetical protein
VAGPRALLSYMRMVSPGSPVDASWSVPQQIVNQIRLGKRHAPPDSPLTLSDVMARDDYRDLMRAKVAEGDVAPDFDLPLLGDGRVRLADLRAAGPVALVFGSYT